MILSPEIFKLDCHACARTVTIKPVDGEQPCPLCGATLVVQWTAEQPLWAIETGGHESEHGRRQ